MRHESSGVQCVLSERKQEQKRRKRWGGCSLGLSLVLVLGRIRASIELGPASRFAVMLGPVADVLGGYLRHCGEWAGQEELFEVGTRGGNT